MVAVERDYARQASNLMCAIEAALGTLLQSVEEVMVKLDELARHANRSVLSTRAV